MFNYTKETILNDLAKVIVGNNNNMFGIKRAGNYDFAKVEGLKIYKTKGVKGSVAKLEITVGTAMEEGVVYRFSMFVDTPHKELVEFAFPNWQDFGKPILVEFAGKGSVNDDAAALARALKLALQPDNELYKVEAAGAKVTITFAAPWLRIKEYAFEYYDEVSDVYRPEQKLVYVLTQNVEDFATADWLVENLRFPSYPNRRYAALYADEAPVAGKVYNQYAFEYRVKKAVPGGLNAVGEVIDSITSHIIYVPAELCADDMATANTFEKLIQDATAGTSTIAAGPHANEQVITLVVA